MADDIDSDQTCLNASSGAVELLCCRACATEAIVQEHHQRREDAEEQAKAQDDAVPRALSHPQECCQDCRRVKLM